MDIEIEITNETEYAAASARVDEIFDARKGSEEYHEKQALLKAIKIYEDNFMDFLKDYI